MAKEYVPVAKVSELPAGALKLVHLGNEDVCLANSEGTIYGMSDICTHAGCSLAEYGEVDGVEIECTCHGSRFELATGFLTHPPAAEPLKRYDVRIEGDDVLLHGA
jgi:3-phenylpropionate/trans-cinnamate dioxygenase ferredoxin subunit